MTVPQTTIEAELAELVEESFTTFCEEIGAMFEWEMESERKDVCVETVKGLQKRFKKFVAVYDVQTRGVLNGTFQVIFDHAGLFTLAGMIVMLPEKLISKHRKCGTVKEANEINDSVKEAGNLFIGSLDKVFREGMEGHGHFLHTNTFVGEPWKESEERTGEAFAEEFLFIAFEMKIDPYPPFQCGITFPKNVYDHTAESELSDCVQTEVQAETEQQDQTTKAESDHSTSEEKPEVTPEAEPSGAVTSKTQVEVERQDQTAKSKSDHYAPEEKTEGTPEAGQQIRTTEDKNESASKGSASKGKVEVESENENSVREVITLPEEKAFEQEEEQAVKVIKSDIQRAAAANAIRDLSELRAKDIMQGKVLWCSSEEGMGEVFAKMCQSGMNYALVGPEDAPEGIVSMSDLRAGMSPYLRPEFVKWRRPIDDASLRIKVKWLMNKDVHTVQSQDGLPDVVITMCRLGLHSLPVVGQGGKIEGMVSVFDILRTLSHSDMKVAM